MSGESRRTLFLHVLALGLVTLALATRFLFHDSPAILFASCLAAVAISALAGGDHHIGLAATAYATGFLALLTRADVVSLAAFAATGLAFSAIVRAVHADRGTTGNRKPYDAVISRIAAVFRVKAGDSSRTALLHVSALGVLTLVAGLHLFVSDSLPILFASCFAAVAIHALAGGDHHIGLAATAYAVIALVLLAGADIDAASLTAFAVTGFVFSAAVRAFHKERGSAGGRKAYVDLLCTTGLALLTVVTYADISDLIMRKAAVPSMLQALIVVLLLVVIGLWRTARPIRVVTQPVVAAFAVYALVVFATSIWARDAALVDRRVAELARALLICVLAASLAISWSVLRSAMTALVVTASVLSAVSVVQITTGRLFGAFGGLITPQTGTLYEHLAVPRASGPPNSDPNFYARILLLAIPLAVGLALVARTRAIRLACAAGAAIITAATLLTYSRGAMVALAAAALMLLAGLHVRPSRIAAAVVAAAVLLLVPSGVARRIRTILPAVSPTQEHDGAIEKRKLLARAGLAMLEAHPLTGVGAGHFGRFYSSFANDIGSSEIDYHVPGTMENPHGLYLEIGAETGVTGLAAFAAVLVAVLSSLHRSRREATARGDRDLETIALMVTVAISGYLVASVFLHETHFRYLALFIGFAIAVSRLVRGEVHA